MHSTFKVFKSSAAIYLIAFLMSASFMSHANPIHPVVKNGQAIFSQNGAVLNIQNTPNTIIDWQRFSIGKGETTYFQQQSANSRVLNRVDANSQAPSLILGKLASNGKVFLINPNGMVFGAGAVLDTAGLVASTLPLRDRNFLNGSLQFEQNGASKADASQAISIQGAATSLQGEVYLVAHSIQHQGTLDIQHGAAHLVSLVSGDRLTVLNPGMPQIQYDIQPVKPTVLDLSNAQNGAQTLFTASLNPSSTHEANSVQQLNHGIILQSTAVASHAALVPLSIDNNAGSLANGAKNGDTIAGKITPNLSAANSLASPLVSQSIHLSRAENSAASKSSLTSNSLTSSNTALVANGVNAEQYGVVPNPYNDFSNAQSANNSSVLPYYVPGGPSSGTPSTPSTPMHPVSSPASGASNEKIQALVLPEILRLNRFQALSLSDSVIDQLQKNAAQSSSCM